MPRRRTLHDFIMREAAACGRMKPKVTFPSQEPPMIPETCNHDPRTTGGGLTQMGAVAFRQGKLITDNPMREGSRAWEAWRAGWLEASAHRDHGVTQ